jgi:lysozyme
MKVIPFTRPRKLRVDVERLARAGGINAGATPVYLVGIRGYYHDDHKANQRGIYDDALFLVSPDAMVAFNANVDPSVSRPGIATLKTGLWRYKLGTHGLNRPKPQRYQALVQMGEVTVVRDGQGDDTGFFGINIHRGGTNSTSSLGCQTIVPEQWENFIGLIKQELNRVGQVSLPYLLTE